MRALVFLAGASTRRSMASEFAVSPEVIDSEVLKSYKGLAAKFFDIWLESVQFRARCSGDYLQKPKWARYTISATRPPSALQTLPLLRGKQASSLVQIRSNSLQDRFRHKSISVQAESLSFKTVLRDSIQKLRAAASQCSDPAEAAYLSGLANRFQRLEEAEASMSAQNPSS